MTGHAGNHEYSALDRFLNQTYGEGVVSTATTGLGALLSHGNMLASSGGHGQNPSHTSRWFSIDFGLLHLVALDLNLYYRGDPSTADGGGWPAREEQLAWLRRDLAMADANRDNVPWIVVMSHFPFYCTGCTAQNVSSSYYESNEAERFGNANAKASDAFDRSRRQLPDWEVATTQQPKARDSVNDAIKDLLPLFRGGDNSSRQAQRPVVDMYLAGHWHYYESLWPAADGHTGSGGQPLAKDFVNPKATIHVTTGNGGPPSADTFREDCPKKPGANSGDDCGSIPATRYQSTKFGYGRLTAFNASHLQYEQVVNHDSSVEDQWMVVRN